MTGLGDILVIFLLILGPVVFGLAFIIIVFLASELFLRYFDRR